MNVAVNGMVEVCHVCSELIIYIKHTRSNGLVEVGRKRADEWEPAKAVLDQCSRIERNGGEQPAHRPSDACNKNKKAPALGRGRTLKSNVTYRR
jgi:hypothetical protein